jgi:transcriptional regulator with PAS, ATPase and Fis domain
LLLTLAPGRLVVGREASCELVLDGVEISRRHAEFRVDGPVTAVRDLESRNGVIVNGVRQTDVPLAVGDVVRCGEWIGIVVWEEAGATPGPETGFAEIISGWFGGATLAAAVAPFRRFPVDLPIVIQGETGTGKEGVARAVHEWSGRSGPLVAVNCAALPGELAEAELFGYRKGAFTGAQGSSEGLFRAAEGGSIFLDEVLDLPLPLQPKLLRVLQERKVRALGETRDHPIDVRVIAATQEPLGTAVAERRFRADLQARLEGGTVVLPALRERREDIAPLFFQFLRASTSGRPPVEAKLVEALCLYDWPLNVRQLLLLTRQLASMHGHEGLLKKVFLPDRILNRSAEAPAAASGPAAAAARRARHKTSDETEFEALIEALRQNAGSVARAAAAIGVSRARAYRLLSAHPDFSLDDIREP